MRQQQGMASAQLKLKSLNDNPYLSRRHHSKEKEAILKEWMRNETL